MSSGRDVEASILTKAAYLLTYCVNNWHDSERSAKLNEALKFNQTVWSIFQSELVKTDNPLPQKIREDLLSLSLFIDRRIMDVMIAPAPEKLNIIININLNIAAGLRSNS
jgi:flagellar biosynthesis activator protein FlaF